MKFIPGYLILVAFVFAGSSVFARSGPPEPGTTQDIAALAQAIRSLGDEVDPEEARRAAQITYRYTYQLAQEYQITDRPLLHNTKVNMGTKPRGLCWHWAQDIEARLNEEGFKTLEMHRAVANAFNIRLEHSTAVISRKGDDYQQGIILDPWRKGGEVFWARTPDDRRYKWLPRAEVLAKKRVLKKQRAADDKKRMGRIQYSRN